MSRRCAAVVAVLVSSLALAARPLGAQAPSPIAREAHVLTQAAAARALEGAQAEARRNGWLMSISVVDPAGELIAFVRTDGAPPSSVDLSQAKARTAARMRRPTKSLEDAVTGGRNVVLGLPGYIPLDGGVPVIVNGEVVGAVGVSGASSAQDGQVAQAGATAASRP